MALGAGVTAIRKHDAESEFGYVALSSIGPILFVLLLGIIFGSSESGAIAEEEETIISFWNLFGLKFREVGFSLRP